MASSVAVFAGAGSHVLLPGSGVQARLSQPYQDSTQALAMGRS